MRRSILALTLALFALTATNAEAAHVTSLRNWAPANHYLVEANVDGRTAPRSEPRAKIDWRKKGQWVKITCQAKGEGQLWDKVGGYYVPDRYIKTYTDGRIPGAPRCKAKQSPTPTPTPTPPPAPAPGHTLPDPQGGYGSYDQTYDLGKRFKGWDYDELSSQLTHHFSRVFPFQGCGQKLWLGKKCTLKVAHSPDGPVKVVALAQNGIALLSLKGHPEGAGRTITFRWARYCGPESDYIYCDYTYLLVNAWGPVSKGSLLGSLNSDIVAHHFWSNLAKNITKRYPKCPKGKLWVKNGKYCGVMV